MKNISGSLNRLRSYILKNTKYKNYQIGEGFICGEGISIWAKNKITIGKSFHMGKDSLIESDVIIGNDVTWEGRVALVEYYDHDYEQVGVPKRLQTKIRDKNFDWHEPVNLTSIANDVYIGFGTIITTGISIGEGSIIYAGSLLLTDVEPFSIYAGIPAEKLDNRFQTTEELNNYKKLTTR